MAQARTPVDVRMLATRAGARPPPTMRRDTNVLVPHALMVTTPVPARPAGAPPEKPTEEGPCRLDAERKKQILAEAQTMMEEVDPGVIENTQITLFSYEDMLKYAVAQITSPEEEGKFTVNDPRLGVTEGKVCCKTCHKGREECDGHFGIIPLPEKFYHPQYMREIISVLNSVCNSCGNLLLTRDDLKKENILRYSGYKRLEMIEAVSLKLDEDKTVCRRKNEPPTRPCGVRPEYLQARIKDTGQIMFRIGLKKEKKETIKPIEDVYAILNSISDEDARLLGFERGAHPRNFILRALPVIPPPARPPQIREGMFFPNAFTKAYRDIIRYCNVLERKHEIERETDGPRKIEDARKRIFFYISHLIDNSDRNYVTHRNRPFDAIKDLLQTKEGLIRGLMMGKRVDFSGRTVASPDPTLRFGEFRMPAPMAQKLTVPVLVTERNRSALQLLLNPPNPNEPSRITHVTQAAGALKGTRFLLTPHLRQRVTLEVGDRIERWRQNGDPAVLNRQPTLHKQSMMGYRVVIGQQLTFGVHLCYTPALNMDFDGDEGNTHAPQSVDTEAELYYLTNVINNIISPETSRPMTAAVFDMLDGSYLLTQDNVNIALDSLDDLYSVVTRRDQFSSLPFRLRKHNVRPTSGRALLSILFPADFTYAKDDVVIRDGIVISGSVTKDQVGNSHGSIVQVLHKEYGKQRTADFLTDLPFLIDRWFIIRGFSVGLADCVLDQARLEQLLLIEINKAKLKIRALGEPPSDPLERERYEKSVSAIVRSVRDIGIQIVDNIMPLSNSFRLMTKSKAKGSETNVAQITALLGQQFVKGERIKQTISRGQRCLPVFDFNDLNPEARGFVTHGFLQGLSPAELFFHLTGTREGLTDTAIKTAETGAMHQRIVNALKSITVAYDGSVRGPTGVVFQFAYGDDGFDPAEMQRVKLKGDDLHSFIDLRGVVQRINSRYGQ